MVHSETPTAKIRNEGGRLHGFQVWLNLPRVLKMTPPRYQERKAEEIPTVTSADELARVTVIAGEALGVEASISTHTGRTISTRPSRTSRRGRSRPSWPDTTVA